MARVSKQEILVLQKKFSTDAGIGKQFGISRQAIHQLRIKYGIKPNTAKNKERNQKIAALYKNGKTGIEIGKTLDMSVSQVYRIIKKGSKR